MTICSSYRVYVAKLTAVMDGTEPAGDPLSRPSQKAPETLELVTARGFVFTVVPPKPTVPEYVDECDRIMGLCGTPVIHTSGRIIIVFPDGGFTTMDDVPAGLSALEIIQEFENREIKTIEFGRRDSGATTPAVATALVLDPNLGSGLDRGRGESK